MRVVLDTNVLISAFIASGTCRDIYDRVIDDHILVSSDYILDEFTRVLIDKFSFPKQQVSNALALIRADSQLVKPAVVELDQLTDKDDLPVLGTVLSGKCHCLVTGDRSLRAVRQFNACSIVSPRDFWHLGHDSLD